MTWALVETWCNQKPTPVEMAKGAVIGLLGVAPKVVMAIGCITALIFYFSIQLKMRLGFDDLLDTLAVHGVEATIGALLTGIFAKQELIEGHPDTWFASSCLSVLRHRAVRHIGNRLGITSVRNSIPCLKGNRKPRSRHQSAWQRSLC